MRIAVIGGGISGLATAYYVKKQYPWVELKLFEKGQDTGGHVRTLRLEGFVFDQGPRGIRPSGGGEGTLELIRELRLWDEMVLSDEAAKIRYVYWNKRLEKLPGSFGSFLFSSSFFDFFKAIIIDLKCRPELKTDESVEDFARRHFGDKITQKFMDPLVSGVWAGDMSSLSIRALSERFHQIDQKYGSLMKGFFKERGVSKKPSVEPGANIDRTRRAALISFKEGIQRLTDRLAEVLGDQITRNISVEELRPSGTGWRVYAQGQSWDFDRVISTVPAYVLSRILHSPAPELKEALERIKYAPLAIVNLAYEKLVNPYKGFGYLVPREAEENILGMIWNDQTFTGHAPKGRTSLTVMIGGARFGEFAFYSDEDFMKLAEKTAQKHLRLNARPTIRLCRVIPRAIPQYEVGHSDLVKTMEIQAPRNLVISGNFIGGISVNDIIRNAKTVYQLAS